MNRSFLMEVKGQGDWGWGVSKSGLVRGGDGIWNHGVVFFLVVLPKRFSNQAPKKTSDRQILFQLYLH